jgi:hypothetical protein
MDRCLSIVGGSYFFFLNPGFGGMLLFRNIERDSLIFCSIKIVLKKSMVSPWTIYYDLCLNKNLFIGFLVCLKWDVKNWKKRKKGWNYLKKRVI